MYVYILQPHICMYTHIHIYIRKCMCVLCLYIYIDLHDFNMVSGDVSGVAEGNDLLKAISFETFALEFIFAMRGPTLTTVVSLIFAHDNICGHVACLLTSFSYVGTLYYKSVNLVK